MLQYTGKLAFLFFVVVVVAEVLLYVRRNRRLIRDRETRTATSTFTQLLSSEFCYYSFPPSFSVYPKSAGLFPLPCGVSLVVTDDG